MTDKPTDEELIGLMPQMFRSGLDLTAKAVGEYSKLEGFGPSLRGALDVSALEYARAVWDAAIASAPELPKEEPAWPPPCSIEIGVRRSIDDILSSGYTLEQVRELFTSEIDWRLSSAWSYRRFAKPPKEEADPASPYSWQVLAGAPILAEGSEIVRREDAMQEAKQAFGLHRLSHESCGMEVYDKFGRLVCSEHTYC